MKKLFPVLVNAALLSSMASLSAYEITPMSEEAFLTYKSQQSCSCDEQIVFSHTNVLPATNENTEVTCEEEAIADLAEVTEGAQVESEEEIVQEEVAAEAQEEVAAEAQEEVAAEAQEEVAAEVEEKTFQTSTTTVNSNVTVDQNSVFSVKQAKGMKASHSVKNSTNSSLVIN